MPLTGKRLFGNPWDRRRDAAQGLKLYATSQSVEVEAALAFARAGDVGQTASLAQDRNSRLP